MDDDEDDGAFVRELLALLEASEEAPREHEPVGAEPSPPLGQWRVVATSANSSTRMKMALAALREEVERLSVQLEQLRSSRKGVVEQALMERLKRQRAEEECRHLREAVYEQTRFIRGLRSVFSNTPRSTLDLCRYLHRHTRLPRNHVVRWGEYDSNVHAARIQMAMDILRRETESIALSADSSPFVDCELIEESNSHSMTATAVYTIDTNDIGAVVRGVCVAVRDIMTYCPFGHQLCVSRDIVDANAAPSSNILYRVMGLRHGCVFSGEDLFIACHVITTYKVTDDYAVVLWDFVDDDELHPALDLTNVTREITGGCLVRREKCVDGVERVVFRSVSTKKFRFHTQMSADRLQKFVCVAQPIPMVRFDELQFRRIVLEQIAAEEAAYARIHAS